MVVRRFFSRYPYTNGITKELHKTKDEIKVEYSSIDTVYPTTIYETAIFEDNDSYFQSYLSSESYIALTFDKYVFISHFAIRPRIVDNKQWCPPKNVSLTSCLDGICFDNYKEEASEKYESTKMKLTPVIPSVSNIFNFSLSGVGTGSEVKRWHTIGRLEIFSFMCDTKEECNGKLMNIVNTCKVCSPIHSSPAILFMIIVC